MALGVVGRCVPVLVALLPLLLLPPQSALALNAPSIDSVSPSSPASVGSNVCIQASIQWTSDFRALRVRFGNEGWKETGAASFQPCFSTSSYSAGTYTI